MIVLRNCFNLQRCRWFYPIRNKCFISTSIFFSRCNDRNASPTRSQASGSREISSKAPRKLNLNPKEEEPKQNRKLEQLILDYPSMEMVVQKSLLIPKTQIEDFLIDNRVRVNGKIVKNLDANATTGDVIDVIKRFSVVVPTKLLISRVEILDVSRRPLHHKTVAVAIRRHKSVKVDNYAGEDAYAESNTNSRTKFD